MTNNFEAKKNSFKKPPQLSKEDWIAKKKAERDAAYALIDDAIKEITTSPENFKMYLDTQSRMDRYSASNALLIYKQLPEASQLKDFSGWAEEKVSIKKGAKSISIFEPSEFTKSDGSTGISYNVKKMFDVTQTKNGKLSVAPTENRNPKKLVAAMLDTSPVAFEAVDNLPFPDKAALYDNTRQKLYVKRDVGNSTFLCQAVAEELSHAQLSCDSNSYSREKNAFNAICVGYMLCSKFGVDTKAFAIDRIPDEWRNKEPKEIRSELSKIRTAMSEIYSRVSDELYRKSQEHNREYER